MALNGITGTTATGASAGLLGTPAKGSASQAAASQARLDGQLNQFLNLLVTQLKNQDPLNPMDATEFTSQLVQFASVEQQIYQNSNLEKLLALQQSSQVSSMVGFIGTVAEVKGNKLPLENGKAEFTYTLPTNAASVKINVKNSSGITVFTADGPTSAGKHDIMWDGAGLGGMPQPAGAYTVTVTAFGPTQNLINVDQTAFGRVTGSEVQDGTVSLLMGDITVPMENVIAVRENPATGAHP